MDELDELDRSWRWWAAILIVLFAVLWAQAEMRFWRIRTAIDHVQASR